MKTRLRSACIMAVCVLAAALGLSGCFHPLYGTSGGKDIAAEMRAISVDPIPDRIGHYLANDLTFALHGGVEEAAPRYHLIVTTSESVQTALVDSVQGRATAGTLIVSANYRLVGNSSPVILTTGTVTSLVTYDRTEQRYSNIRAAINGEVRNSGTIADQVKTRLAIYFASRP